MRGERPVDRLQHGLELTGLVAARRRPARRAGRASSCLRSRPRRRSRSGGRPSSLVASSPFSFNVGFGSDQLHAELAPGPWSPGRAAPGPRSSLPAASKPLGSEGELLAGDGDRRRRTPCRRRWPTLPSLVLVLVDDDPVEGDQAAEQLDVRRAPSGARHDLVGRGDVLAARRCSPRSRRGPRARAGTPRAPGVAGAGSLARVLGRRGRRTGDRLAERRERIGRGTGDPGQAGDRQSRDLRQAGDAGRTFAPVLASTVLAAVLPHVHVAVGREAGLRDGLGRRSRWCAIDRAGERLVGHARPRRRAGWR